MSWPVANNRVLVLPPLPRGMQPPSLDSETGQRIHSALHKRTKHVDKRVRYAAGMLFGLVAVHWSKRFLRSIPVLGALSSPLLRLLPTLIVGPVVGATVVFGVEQGDLKTARRKVVRHVHTARQEVTGLFDDLGKEVRGRDRRGGRAQRDVQMAWEEAAQHTRNAAEDLHKAAKPVLVREQKRIQEAYNRAVRTETQ